MGANYVEYTSQDVACVLGPIGFVKAKPENNCQEEVYYMDVKGTSGNTYPYYVKIYTSVDIRTGTTRDCGNDAIRLCLMDRVTGWAIRAAEKRVYRTKSAMPNMVERVRELFRFVFESPKCPKCGAIQVERKGPKGTFLGCSHYGPDKPWHCDGKAVKAQEKAQEGPKKGNFDEKLIREFLAYLQYEEILDTLSFDEETEWLDSFKEWQKV